MNRAIRTVVQILAITAIFAVLGIIYYYAGAEIVKGSPVLQKLRHGLTEWKGSFFYVALITAGVCWLLAMIWYVMARWLLKIRYVEDADKRPIWLLFWLLCAIASLALPFILTNYTELRVIQGLGGGIYWLGFSLFGLLGYYFSTAMFTPDHYKYVPFGGSVLHLLSAKKGA